MHVLPYYSLAMMSAFWQLSTAELLSWMYPNLLLICSRILICVAYNDGHCTGSPTSLCISSYLRAGVLATSVCAELPGWMAFASSTRASCLACTDSHEPEA